MSKETGGFAFPCEVGLASDDYMIQTGISQWCQPGMTLRDYFAGKALGGICAVAGVDFGGAANVATICYCLADAMIEARKA